MKLYKINRYVIACTLFLSVTLSNTALAATKLVYDGSTHNYTEKPIVLNVEGKNVETSVPPLLINDRTLVPVRGLFEQLGAEVLWVEKTQQVFVSLGNNSIVLTIDKNVAQVNGQDKIMDVSPKIIANNSEYGSTMIPVRFVAEALNYKVGWNESTRVVSINKPTNTTPTTPVTPMPEQKPGSVILKGDGSIKYENSTYPTIQPINSDSVEITSVVNSGNQFKIAASGKISSVSYGVIENPTRLYVDITNSSSKLESSIGVSGSNSVIGIRTSQKENSVSRIVFDLSKSQDFNIYLSEDRTTLNVDFKPIIVDSITFEKANGTDSININASSEFTPVITKLSNPDRIAIDIPGAFSTIGTKSNSVSGNFVSSIRTSQFETNTVRVVLDAIKPASYEVSQNNLCTTIKLIQPTQKAVSYSNAKVVLKKDANHPIDINSIIHEDNYLERNYKLTLPGDYKSSYGYGTYTIDDDYLNYMSIQNTNGKTEIVFSEKNIYAYTVQQDAQNIYINVLNPKSVYKRVVVIDAGHGEKDSGTPQNVYNGVVEKEINLSVSNKLYALLKADPNIKVYATRIADTYPTLTERADMANSIADMFVSMHCNSISNSEITGVQVLYPDFSDTRGVISKQLATLLMNKVVALSEIPQKNLVQRNDLAVLKNTIVPASLVEMGFLTNLYDATKLSDDNCQQAIAQGLYQGIKEAFATIIPAR